MRSPAPGVVGAVREGFLETSSVCLLVVAVDALRHNLNSTASESSDLSGDDMSGMSADDGTPAAGDMGDDTSGGDAPGTGGMGTPPTDDQDDETSSKVLCPGNPLGQWSAFATLMLHNFHHRVRLALTIEKAYRGIR